MTSCLVAETQEDVAVKMGQAIFAGAPAKLTAILGSCVAVTLYAPRFQVGMLSHVVLPHSNSGAAHPAKFADTAVPHMLSVLAEHGMKPRGLIAKIVGGACMFGSGSNLMEIGKSNARAAVEALHAARIPIAGQEIAGSVGRRICFDLATGCITVESPGHPLRTI
jgi:chemotaxis protein CheD